MLRISNIVPAPTRQSFREWFDSPLADTTSAMSARRRPTHGEYIKAFYSELCELISDHGYTLEDEKGFKRSITTFLYHLSSEADDE